MAAEAFHCSGVAVPEASATAAESTLSANGCAAPGAGAAEAAAAEAAAAEAAAAEAAAAEAAAAEAAEAAMAVAVEATLAEAAEETGRGDDKDAGVWTGTAEANAAADSAMDILPATTTSGLSGSSSLA